MVTRAAAVIAACMSRIVFCALSPAHCPLGGLLHPWRDLLARQAGEGQAVQLGTVEQRDEAG